MPDLSGAPEVIPAPAGEPGDSNLRMPDLSEAPLVVPVPAPVGELVDPNLRKELWLRQLELISWLAAAVAAASIKLLLRYLDGDHLIFGADIVIGVFFLLLVLVIPVVFQMTFGTLPFAAVRAWLGRKSILTVNSGRATHAASTGVLSPDEDVWAGSRFVEDTPTAKSRNDPRELLVRFAEESAELTRKVYGRSGVYLIVGLFLAIGGLGFFYIRSITLLPEKDLIDRALSLLPGFGILFFIEFVALFFLRQHRAAMDDLRYYDAVRRHREENLVILTMFAENTSVVPTVDVIKAMTIYSGGQKLMAGETTEILEARRLQGDGCRPDLLW